jgi:hypothetical protein
MLAQFVHLVLLGCSNMGIVATFVKFLEVCLQNSGEFCGMLLSFICLY